MTIERFRVICAARPFSPVTLALADGRTFAVRHPEVVTWHATP